MPTERTAPAAETLEQIAERVIDGNLDIHHYSTSRRDLIASCLSALRNERERCAEAGFNAVMALGDSVYEYSVTQKAAMIAAAIRKG